jgi:cytochrome c-type biogenesis protein CcmF
MIPEFGHFALLLALPLAVLLGVLPLLGAWRGERAWMAVARPAALALFVAIALSFACLARSFLVDDFSVAYVAAHSNSQLPAAYKFAAVWGGHEGSFLLWMLMLTGWTVAVAAFSRSLPLEMVARVLGVLGMVATGFLVFVIATSDPFERLLPAVAEGQDLNPLLQDPGLVMHPPMLYMGYVGFSVAFAFALAALLAGRLDAAWARWSRPWRLVVLGPGGERVLHAVAGRHGADPLAGRDGEARVLPQLDRAARHRRVLAVAARHLPRALGRADLGSRVRQ